METFIERVKDISIKLSLYEGTLPSDCLCVMAAWAVGRAAVCVCVCVCVHVCVCFRNIVYGLAGHSASSLCGGWMYLKL